MNTETRLRDALGAAARTVPENATGPGLETARSRRSHWPAVALAVATALVIAGVVPYALQLAEPEQQVSPSAADGAPPYFVGLRHDGREATVYDSATGRTRGEIPVEPGLRLTAVAAAADQRTFYFGAINADCEARILRVELDADGAVSDVADVSKSHVERRHIVDLAVSPNGRKLAISSAGAEPAGQACSISSAGSSLFVLDVTTGNRRAWESPHPGDAPRELSWAPDNRTLALTWTESSVPVQLRRLDTAAPGRDLAASRVVYRTRGGSMGRLSITADGRWAQAVLEGTDGTGLALVRVALANGRVEVLDDRLDEKGITFVVADASRKHLLAWGHPKVGRYLDGQVDWFDPSYDVMRFAW